MTGPIDFNGKTYSAGAQKNVKNDTIGQKPKFNPGGIFKEAAKGAVRGGAEGLTNPPKKLENVDLTFKAEYESNEVTLINDTARAAGRGAVKGGAEGLTNPPKKLENVDSTFDVEYTSKEVTLSDD